MAEHHSDQEVGNKIVELRESLGMTQGQLAEQLRSRGLGWSQGTLSKVETGQRSVRLTEAPVVALVLRVRIDELAGIEDARPSGQMPALLQHEVLDQLDLINDALQQARSIKTLADQSIPALERSWDTTSRVLDHLVGKAETDYEAGPPVEQERGDQ
ncbi:helix-turn-helix transcriptional regulator [Rhodococcus pseudokoreensis]|uniref:Helix-turn-helix transcriptional regulator n=1 Tax=Rhodococcus pseudokoreensis TaxID=2811421 RepID=A0A974W437_9NOCA|nr:helix-turn-helix transcriptional regulator [Rhodococcus pseudokoreensis]QSE90302.1 helix-turn-helix transcriptional regulator [Rhodococcus pseudokoreensis]